MSRVNVWAVPWLAQLLAGEARVRFQASRHGVYDGQNGRGTGVSAVIIIPPVLHTHISFKCNQRYTFRRCG
jgi:hypothetical protein